MERVLPGRAGICTQAQCPCGSSLGNFANFLGRLRASGALAARPVSPAGTVQNMTSQGVKFSLAAPL